jgi:hypothetical protein
MAIAPRAVAVQRFTAMSHVQAKLLQKVADLYAVFCGAFTSSHSNQAYFQPPIT